MNQANKRKKMWQKKNKKRKILSTVLRVWNTTAEANNFLTMNLLNHLQPMRSEGSSKLAVPGRHSYATSISSLNYSNLTPQHFASQRPQTMRSGSSAHYRLSRSNTNITADNYSTQDSQSIATIDKIPATKPTVTYLDKLWTQIDIRWC